MLREIEDFLLENDYAYDTIKTYRYHLCRLTTWLVEHGYTLPDLTPAQFKTYLLEQPWGDSHQYNSLCAVKAFVRWKYGQHQMLRMKISRAETPPQRTLSEEQVKQLIASIDTSKPKGIRNLALISLLLDTGLRASEICRLELKYLDLENQTFGVRAKGRRWREGVYSDVTSNRLRAWLEIRATIACEGVNTVFVAIKGITPGRPLTRYGLTMVFRYAAQEAGLKDGLSSHDFRRTFATLAFRRGASTRLVQVAGGWQDIRQVEHYSRALTPSDFAPYFPTEFGREVV